MLSFFECIKRSSSVSLEDTRLIATVNWIFHVSDLSMYGLILLRYASIDSVLFLSPVLSYSR